MCVCARMCVRACVCECVCNFRFNRKLLLYLHSITNCEIFLPDNYTFLEEVIVR